MSTNFISKLENETIEEFILRTSNEKQNDNTITWQQIADSLFVNYGLERSEGWVRRVVKSGLQQVENEDILDAMRVTNEQITQNTLELKKQRVKLSEERTQNNAHVRQLAREELIKEIALDVARNMSAQKQLKAYQPVVNASTKEAICCISDWHYGLEFKNAWNTFSTDICKQRVSTLRDKVIEYVRQHKCKTVHIVNLSDLIAGRIHLTIRLESKIDVITQILEVSEIVAEFITDISKYANIEYYDALDNHSRLEPIKNDSQNLESLARIIPWYLKERVKQNQRIKIHSNDLSPDIITFSVCGHDIIAVHGDNDKPGRVIENLTAFTRKQYDLVLMAHRHHMSMDESCGTVLLCNGSLMGTDSFAQKLRLNSPPSQNLVIVSEDNICECIYRILL